VTFIYFNIQQQIKQWRKDTFCVLCDRRIYYRSILLYEIEIIAKCTVWIMRQ